MKQFTFKLSRFTQISKKISFMVFMTMCKIQTFLAQLLPGSSKKFTKILAQ